MTIPDESFTADDILSLPALSFRPAPAALSWRQFDIALRRCDGDAMGSARYLFGALVPILHAAVRDQRLHSWFFMRKPPDVRLRVLAPTEHSGIACAIDSALATLGAENAIGPWHRGQYRPEQNRFGGAAALANVHAYFHLDSVLWWAMAQSATASQPGIAADTMLAMVFQHLFECAGARIDVDAAWQALAELTEVEDPVSTVAPYRPSRLAELAAERSRPAIERACLTVYREANETLGRRLVALANSGQTRRPLPEIVATLALFNFNRHGIPGQRSHPLVRSVAAATRSR